MEIRPATVEDADAIASTVLAVLRTSLEGIVDPQEAEEREPADEAAEWRPRLADGTRHLVLVACHDDRPLGVAAWLLPRRSSPEDRVPDAVLSHLLVHPAAQGAGLGSLLLRRAEDELRTLGGTAARTDLHADAWWATRFFGGRGWTRTDTPADGEHETWTRAL